MTEGGLRLRRPTTVPTDALEVYVAILTAVPDTMRRRRRAPEALDDHTTIRQLHGMVRLGNEVANGGFSRSSSTAAACASMTRSPASPRPAYPTTAP